MILNPMNKSLPSPIVYSLDFPIVANCFYSSVMVEGFQNHFILSFMECFRTVYNQTYMGQLSLVLKIATVCNKSVHQMLRAQLSPHMCDICTQ